jgi:hypothetical protein
LREVSEEIKQLKDNFRTNVVAINATQEEIQQKDALKQQEDATEADLISLCKRHDA